MRRSDREITDFTEIIQVMEACDVCRLAFQDGDYPYIIPLNFGMELENGKVILYFHGALQGKKYELIERNKKASFEMDCKHRLVMMYEKKNCTMEYESVIGQGTIEIVSDREKQKGLEVLMRHYHKEDFPINQAVIPHTNVFKLTVETMTGKRRMTKIQDK